MSEDLYKNDIENRFPTFTLAKTTDGDFTEYTLKDGSTLLATGRSLDAGFAVLRVREQMIGGPEIKYLSTTTQRDALTGVLEGETLLNITTTNIERFESAAWVPTNQVLLGDFTFQGSTKFGGLTTIAPNGAIDIVGSNTATSRIRTIRFQDNFNGSAMQMGLSRGSEGTPGAVESGDRLGQLLFLGDDGVVHTGSGPVIRCFTVENWGASARGSKITVETVKPGATDETLAVTFSEHGYPETPSYTVATLPNVGGGGGIIYVTDETGGATHASSDGTNWRRMSDRAIVA